MQLIRIAGPTAAMRRLGDIEGLDVERTSARRVEGDRWRVSGYASDEALAALAEREVEVEVVIEPAVLADERSTLYARLDAAGDEEPPGEDEDGG